MNKSLVRGFTLIELLVTIVILGIIAAVAYPSYRDSARRSGRSDAKVGLQQAAQALERCYAQHHDYTDTNCGFATQSPNGYYAISAQIPSPTSYTLTATPVAGRPQSDDDDCTSFSLSSTGAQTATGQNTNECW